MIMAMAVTKESTTAKPKRGKDSRFGKIDPEVYQEISRIKKERVENSALIPVEERMRLFSEFMSELYEELEKEFSPDSYFSQATFAKCLDMNPATIHKYMSRPTDPIKVDIDQLQKLAFAKGWTLDQLVRYFRAGIRPGAGDREVDQMIELLESQPILVIQLIDAIKESGLLRKIAESCIKNLPVSMIPGLIESSVKRISNQEVKEFKRVASNSPVHTQLRQRQSELNLSDEEFRIYGKSFGVTDSEWDLFWSDRYIPTGLLAKLSRLTNLPVDALAELKDNHPDAPQPNGNDHPATNGIGN